MPAPAVVFDGVWKKFRRGERHDSLRDLVPAAARRLFRRARPALDEREFWALRGVSFSVAPGEALGIIGPNGAGKSTSLKLLTRILKPTRGRCHAHGRVGALIEVAAGFHPDLTGRENIFFQGAIMGMKRVEIGQRFDEIVEFAGISDFIDTPVKRYSSGMAARLGFSIAAHLSPDVLVIDEVLAVGDMVFQERCYRRMAEFKGNGVAIVFVSHNFAAVTQVCDSVGVLTAGELALYDNPGAGIAAYSTNALNTPERVAGEGTIAILDAKGTAVTRARSGDTVEVVARMISRNHESSLSSSIRIRRVESNEIVYLTTSPSLGTPPVYPPSGCPVEARWKLHVNMARGHYIIEVFLFETVRRLPVTSIAAPPLTVEEAETERGVLHLGASCSIQVKDDRDVDPSANRTAAISAAIS